MKIAICEDNITTANVVEGMIVSSGYSADIFSAGQIFLEYLRKTDEHYNLLFLDIEMPILNGIDTAKQIRTFDNEMLIVFMTDYKEYVYDVFEVQPFRFLQKPVDAKATELVLNSAKEYLSTVSQIFSFSIGKELYSIPYKDILYFESAGRQIIVNERNSMHKYYGAMSALMDELDSRIFARTHASYIVNMEYIRSISSHSVVLMDDKTIPISKKFTANVKLSHLTFLERRM